MQPVKVDEPTVEEAITILKGIQRNAKTTTTFSIPMLQLEAAATLQSLHPRSLLALTRPLTSLDEAGSKMNLTLNFVDLK